MSPARGPLDAVIGFAWVDGALAKRKVVQCALSRVCGGCGEPLGRPIAFVGDPDEVVANEFHLPPMHLACARGVAGALGPDRRVVTTAGFEFVRPVGGDPDQRPRCRPNSLIG